MQLDDDLLEVNCGQCGKRIFVRVEEVRRLRMIDCSECSGKASRPRDVLSVLVAGEPRRRGSK